MAATVLTVVVGHNAKARIAKSLGRDTIRAVVSRFGGAAGVLPPVVGL